MGDNRKVVYAWGAVGFAFLVWAAALFRLSARFGYEFAVSEMPIWTFTALLALGGVVFCTLPLVLRRSLLLTPEATRRLLLFIVVVGVGIRAILIFSEPMLEDDYQRYMWDGAQVAHGLNPYALSPEDAQNALAETVTGRLVLQSGKVIGRINHGQLRTVYPPVAQFFFALSNIIAPFQLTAWRLLILAVDFVVLGLLYLLLRDVGRSPVWLALYWWNPIVAKEFYNSAHMDILIAPFLLGGLYLTIRGRVIATLAALALGVGSKIWPVFLLPLFLRHALHDARRGSWREVWRNGSSIRPVGIGLAVFTLLSMAWAAPILLAGLDSHSGFVAYAEKWQTNSALFPAIKGGFTYLMELAGLPREWGGRAGRLLVIGLMGLFALFLAKEPLAGNGDLVIRCAFMVLFILMLSPAQFPWYLTWFAPFLVFMPLRGLMLLHVTIPFYYLGFHYSVIGDYAFYSNIIVWLIWVPVWLLVIFELKFMHHWSGSLSRYTSQFKV